jgi:hypothetical protein
VPVGSYRVMDGAGNAVGTEEFRAAAGPAGWRYFSNLDTRQTEPHREVIDLVIDGVFRPFVYVSIPARLRSCCRLGRKPSGTLDGDPVKIEWGPDLYLDSLSPAFSAATVNRLGGTADIEVVYLEPVTCLPRRDRQRYELPRGGGDRPAGPPILGPSLTLHGASHGGGPARCGSPGTWWSPTRGYSNWRRTSRGKAGRSRARADGERPPCWRPS